MRRVGVGIFFGMCGTFFQSLTEWVFHQTPIFYTFNILLGVLASLCYVRKLKRERQKMGDMGPDEEDESDFIPHTGDPFIIRH